MLAGAAGQSLMTQFMGSTHQLEPSLPDTNVTPHAQQPGTSLPASQGGGQLQSRVKGRQFREEWKATYPWLTTRDGKCFCSMCS